MILYFNDCTWSVLDPQSGVASLSGSDPKGSTSAVTWGMDDTLYLDSGFSLKVINTLNGAKLYS